MPVCAAEGCEFQARRSPWCFDHYHITPLFEWRKELEPDVWAHVYIEKRSYYVVRHILRGECVQEYQVDTKTSAYACAITEIRVWEPFFYRHQYQWSKDHWVQDLMEKHVAHKVEYVGTDSVVASLAARGYSVPQISCFLGRTQATIRSKLLDVAPYMVIKTKRMGHKEPYETSLIDMSGDAWDV